jgi:hypothetical protein
MFVTLKHILSKINKQQPVAAEPVVAPVISPVQEPVVVKEQQVGNKRVMISKDDIASKKCMIIF